MDKMDMSGWLRTAVAGIRFKPDREAVEAELREHIEDKTAALMRIFPDMTQEEAEDRALSGMGDPEEIGKELAKIHKPWLGWLWVASRWLLGALLLLLAAALCGSLARGDIPDRLRSVVKQWNDTREARVVADALYGNGAPEELEAVMERQGLTWNGDERLAVYDLGREARLGEAGITLSRAALWQTGEGRSLCVEIRLDYDRARDKSDLLQYYLQAEDSLGNHYGHELKVDGDSAHMSGFRFLGRESHWNGWTWNFCIDNIPEEAEWVRFSYALRPETDLGFLIDLTQEVGEP